MTTETAVPVRAAVAAAAARLAGAGVASPRVDAELLVGHVLGVPRGRLALAADLTPTQRDRLEALVAQRAARVPLQHLTGHAGFGPLLLAVGPGVFVPRPETELLGQWAVTIRTGQPAGSVVDLGAGTGALALMVAHARPADRVFAVERDPAALAWLRRNAAARAARGDPPVAVVAADATDPGLLADLAGRVALVVSNPPYVPAGTPVPPEVATHEPAGALFAGPDGLAVIRGLVPVAAGLLQPGGWFGVEHHDTQAEPVARLLGHWFTGVESHPDLAGRPRYLTGRRMAD